MAAKAISLQTTGDAIDSAVASQSAEEAGTTQAERYRQWLPWLLIPLVLVSLGLRLIWLDKPAGSLIFDEGYYVNAARVILNLPTPDKVHYGDAPRGIDPNSEHPPLGKLLIAVSMRLFGDNAWGWRL